MALTKATNSMISGAYINVLDFGATGDGTTDDTVAIQSALDSATSGGVVYFPSGEYRIARNIGTNDRWGIKVTNSNVTLKGEQASFRRYSTDISTYALAYPILLVGVPDSNVAAATTNVVIEGITFVGENTQHSSGGSTLTDSRYAIEFKNTSGTLVKNCTFTAIDSSAIFYQQPAAYDYANSTFFNTTKNYNSKIVDCSFIATAHSTAGRSVLHAIAVPGIDNLVISNNYFEWCDDCVSGEGTYNIFSDTEDDTYVRTGPASALGALKRSGKNLSITGNTVYNSSEHAFYLAVMNCTVSANTIYTDDPAVCTGDQIKIRGRYVTCSGNTISNYGICMSITEPAIDVTVCGNTFQSSGSISGGVIDVTSVGLSAYIDARSWLYVGGSPNYLPMGNFSITGNTIIQPDTAAATNIDGSAIRIYSDTSDVNYPNGQIQGVTFSANTVRGYNTGIYMVNALSSNISVTGNSFYAKAFTKAGFSSGTTLNTRAVIQADNSATTTMRPILFTGNHVDGATYLFATQDGAATPTTIYTPEGIVGNRFNYIKNIKTADVRTFSAQSRFSENTGLYFLDRTWTGFALENSLNDGSVSNSAKRYCTEYTGSNLVFYTNDSNTSITLG